MLWRVPNYHRQVHTAAERTHIHVSTEVVDADVVPIQKFSRCKLIPNDGDRDSPIDPALNTTNRQVGFSANEVAAADKLTALIDTSDIALLTIGAQIHGGIYSDAYAAAAHAIYVPR